MPQPQYHHPLPALTRLRLWPDVGGVIPVNGHRDDVGGAIGQAGVHTHGCGQEVQDTFSAN